MNNLNQITLHFSTLLNFIIITVKEAAEIAHHALFDNHGQSCCAGSRTFVHAKVYDEFVKEAKKLAEDRKVGDPFDEKTDQGPQIDQEMFDKVIGLIEAGKKEGATVVAGGKRVGTVGFFVQVSLWLQDWLTGFKNVNKAEVYNCLVVCF